MTEANRINAYIAALSRALRGFSEHDRQDILQEIRAHLEHRDAEGRLEESLKSLGSPQQCARGFSEELKLQQAFTDRGPARTFAALFALASQRLTAAIGLLISGVFFLCAAGFAFTAFYELVTPDLAGLWSNPQTGTFFFGVIDSGGLPDTRDLLGRWLFPVAALLSLVSLVASQWLGRLFIRLMMRRPRMLS